ncbi:hypothetical protein AVEN_252510-1 [Araneus ventricosus]|uniref:Uncharacterized protein n=1 Tax=Araneus ventricosus TaxID=182803 RepID=A0A4Y2AQY9_ARAVE|nr:hypothetical protein AVEN_252510-1 [Araneus ventricosus]
MINARRCAILHENNVLKASALLKFWDYKISQHITVPLSCDGIGLDSICSYLFKTIWFNDKGSRKTTPYCNFVRMQGMFLDSVRVFRCQVRQLQVLTCPLRQKWASSLHRMFHGQVTSTTI